MSRRKAADAVPKAVEVLTAALTGPSENEAAEAAKVIAKLIACRVCGTMKLENRCAVCGTQEVDSE